MSRLKTGPDTSHGKKGVTYIHAFHAPRASYHQDLALSPSACQASSTSSLLAKLNTAEVKTFAVGLMLSRGVRSGRHHEIQGRVNIGQYGSGCGGRGREGSLQRCTDLHTLLCKTLNISDWKSLSSPSGLNTGEPETPRSSTTRTAARQTNKTTTHNSAPALHS